MQLSSKPANETKSLDKLIKIKNIYMQENSPQNPFGPNYKELPLNTKITYKYSMAKDFFKLSLQDNFHKEVQEQKFLGTLILGFVGGYFVAQIPRLQFFQYRRIYQKIAKRQVGRGLTTVFSMCAFSSLGYLKAHERYFEQVPKKFLDKYLPEAIQNGFQDYQISKGHK